VPVTPDGASAKKVTGTLDGRGAGTRLAQTQAHHPLAEADKVTDTAPAVKSGEAVVRETREPPENERETLYRGTHGVIRGYDFNSRNYPLTYNYG
jgi:hypothetical protein